MRKLEIKETIRKMSDREKTLEYASALYQLTNDIEPWENDLGGLLVWEVKDHALEVNEILHWMHTEDPSLRRKAISLMAEMYYENSTRLTLVEFPIDSRADFAQVGIGTPYNELMKQTLDKKYPGLREKIGDILDPLSDDIKYSFGYTCSNDHVDVQNGQTIELLTLHLESLDSTTLKYVVELIKEEFETMEEIMEKVRNRK